MILTNSFRFSNSDIFEENNSHGRHWQAYPRYVFYKGVWKKSSLKNRIWNDIRDGFRTFDNMLKSSVLEDSYASNLFEQKAVVKNSAASFRQGSCWSSSCDDKQILKAILFVLTTGCRWADLPREYGSYATAWRRLRRWTRDGTLVRIWDVLLAELEFKGKLDLKKCHWMLVCSRKKGGQLVGRTCGAQPASVMPS